MWAERFKSVIVENGKTLINCLAYIDLNPVRAGIVNIPDLYRWNSIGYHVQTDNKDEFLSLDFGLTEFGPREEKERLTDYREFLYEAGAIDRSEKKNRQVIDEKILNTERKKGFKLDRRDRFLHKTRYFTDSGIIGSKKFVAETYQVFKHYFQSKEKKPKTISGLDGIYSMKRLTET